MANGKLSQRDMIRQTHQTLHGVEGKGGVVQLLEDHEKRLRRADRLNTIIHTVWGMVVAYFTIYKRGG